MKPFDVSSSFTQIVDAQPWEAREVLSQIDPMRSLADRLSALGLDVRALWCEGSEELTYRLLWRFDADGRNVKLEWRVSVGSHGAGRTMLTVKLSGRGSDAAARRRALSSWTLLEELAAGHARRLARSVDDYVNADDYEREHEFVRPKLRVVG
jgi:hypothetical protein